MSDPITDMLENPGRPSYLELQREVMNLRVETNQLRAQLAEARALLAKHQWSAYDRAEDYCVECSAYESKGHTPECRWSKAMKGAQEPTTRGAESVAFSALDDGEDYPNETQA